MFRGEGDYNRLPHGFVEINTRRFQTPFGCDAALASFAWRVIEKPRRDIPEGDEDDNRGRSEGQLESPRQGAE